MDQAEYHKNTVTFAEINTYEKVKRLLSFEDGVSLNILDVGSGSGVLDDTLAGFGHRVMGLDVQKPEQQPNGWRFTQCDINQAWPGEPASFDVVICTDVPEHMYSPVHVLSQSKRLLKPGGKLIFGVPNHFDLRQRLRMLAGQGIVHWDNLRHNEKAWSYVHIRFFTLNDLKLLFKESGWHIETVQFNFMGGGIVPSRLTPKFIRTLLLKWWPGLFSGKFIFLLSPEPSAEPAQHVYVPHTPRGM